jgi:hypothetical protein
MTTDPQYLVPTPGQMDERRNTNMNVGDFCLLEGGVLLALPLKSDDSVATESALLPFSDAFNRADGALNKGWVEGTKNYSKLGIVTCTLKTDDAHIIDTAHSATFAEPDDPPCPADWIVACPGEPCKPLTTPCESSPIHCVLYVA